MTDPKNLEAKAYLQPTIEFSSPHLVFLTTLGRQYHCRRTCIGVILDSVRHFG